MSKSSDKSVESPLDLAAILSALKDMAPADLFKVMKAATAEAEKKAKDSMKSVKKEKKKRASSMPKGVVPPQLVKPRAWMDFVKARATKIGWESFTIHTTKKDKTTGEKVEEVVVMPGSMLHDGVHVFEDSVSEAHPKGKTLSHSDVMSLSKTWWTPKTSEGTHEELYREFEAQQEKEQTQAQEQAEDDEFEVSLDVPVVAATTPVALVAEPVAEPKAEAEPKAKAVKKVVKKVNKSE
jgi:hypothetical protein